MQNPNGFLDRSIDRSCKTVMQNTKQKKSPDEAQEEKRRSLSCFLSSLSALCLVNEQKEKCQICIGRESNPGLPRGRREFYH